MKTSYSLDKIDKVIEQTFSLNSNKLPALVEIKPYVGNFDFNVDFALDSFAIREKYLKHCFVVYTDELLSALKDFCDKKEFTVINELCCGTGWFSHWMIKYGIPLKNATDNKSWGKYKANEAFLDIVKKEDAVRFVKNTPETDMYVLSWPYMDPLARMIWDAMKPGQYLLYIGEDWGGCTADESFFQAIDGFEIVDDEYFNKIDETFVQFWGIHDRPRLFKKTLKIEK